MLPTCDYVCSSITLEDHECICLIYSIGVNKTLKKSNFIIVPLISKIYKQNKIPSCALLNNTAFSNGPGNKMYKISKGKSSLLFGMGGGEQI